MMSILVLFNFKQFKGFLDLVDSSYWVYTDFVSNPMMAGKSLNI